MLLLEKWTPFRDIEMIDQRMRRFFEELGVATTPIPAADLYETDGDFVLEVEVPGFDQKELGIRVFDHTLSVTGERAEETAKEATTLRLHERLEKRFERRFQLPTDIDDEHVTAEYAKGILTVHVPKAAAVKPRKVEISKA
jgi:HSP20 family protein